jgi:hypothetical protein
LALVVGVTLLQPRKNVVLLVFTTFMQFFSR